MRNTAVHQFKDSQGLTRRVRLTGRAFHAFDDVADIHAARDALVTDLENLGIVLAPDCLLTDAALIEILKAAQADVKATAAATPERPPPPGQFVTAHDFSENVKRVKETAAAREKAAAASKSLEERLRMRPPAYRR
jgi:hypothetical protein